MAQHLLSLGFDGAITLVGEEAHAPYERPPLSKDFLLGKAMPADFALGEQDSWASPGRLCWKRGRVTRIDVGARRAMLADGTAIGFDILVLATGTRIAYPSLPGVEAPHVHVLRTLDDAIRLREAIGAVHHLAVIGAGVVGMEVAASARAMDIPVTVIGRGPRAMARCIPDYVSAWLEHTHRLQGVDFLFDTRVLGIDAQGVMIEHDGAEAHVAADLVLLATGIVPDLPDLVNPRLDCGNGIAVDAHCRVEGHAGHLRRQGTWALTVSPHYGRPLRQESWRNAENQARAVAEFITGRQEPFVEIPWMWTDQFGRNIQVLGLPDEGATVVHRGDPHAGAAISVHMHEGQVTGAVLIDEGRQRRVLERLIVAGRQVDGSRLADAAVPLKDL